MTHGFQDQVLCLCTFYAAFTFPASTPIFFSFFCVISRSEKVSAEEGGEKASFGKKERKRDEGNLQQFAGIVLHGDDSKTGHSRAEGEGRKWHPKAHTCALNECK